MNYSHQWTGHIAECPQEESALIMSLGNSVSPVGPEILSPVDIIVFNVECPQGRDYSHCAPWELSITSWLWNIMPSGVAILFNVERPRGSLLSLCPRGAQYHQFTIKYDQWTSHIFIMPSGNSISQVGYEISSPVDWPYRSMLSALG